MILRMMTFNRGNNNYIESTIANLARDKKFNDYQLSIHDSGSDKFDFLEFVNEYGNAHIIAPLKRLTPLENFINTLRNESEGWLLFMEDDIRVCDNFFDKVEAILFEAPDNQRIISLYLNYKEGLDDDYYKCEPDKFYGTICFIIRCSDANDLSNWLQSYVDKQETEYDLLMAKWHKERYPEYPIYVKGLAKHIGHISLISSEQGKREEGFSNEIFK